MDYQFYMYFTEWFWICIELSFGCVSDSEGPIDNNSALVQVMDWRWTGDKLLPKPMITQFNDAYMRHLALMNWGDYISAITEYKQEN